MKAIETELKGCFILEPQVYEDSRGYFFELFNAEVFERAIGQKVQFKQDNQSFSTYGVIRALHYQTGVHAQAKLVSVLQGKVLDVVVDLRQDSPTFGKHMAIELTSENKIQMFIPRGFAHGFSVLSESAVFWYKCDNYYNKESEAGIRFDDPSLAIDWKVPESSIKISEKDAVLPNLKEAKLA
jgi:dTDP-4-dehydrorhamnose 3,5-epimerase